MKLFLATGNLHKIEELRAMLAAAGLDLEVHTPGMVGGMPEVVEDQDSFTGNALKKARALAAILPHDGWALADDSGLCVDALDGAPGVLSARYSGPEATDASNMEKLLEALDGIEERNRAAGFRCHLALVSPHGEEYVFEGECRGEILHERRGKAGFGYDPLFVPNGYEATFAELGSGEKAGLSHRGQAMKQLVAWLVERA